MVGIVVVNDSSIVGPGEEKRTSGNADDAASSASLGAYSPFAGPPVPLGLSFSPNSSWPRLLGQALGLESVLMICFVVGLRNPENHSEVPPCGGKLKKARAELKLLLGWQNGPPMVLMMLVYGARLVHEHHQHNWGPFRYASALSVTRTFC